MRVKLVDTDTDTDTGTGVGSGNDIDTDTGMWVARVTRDTTGGYRYR